MRLVRESISFERGRDPKRTLGIGIDPDNSEMLLDYVIRSLPTILGLETIPDDILGDRQGPYIDRKYSFKINEWLVRNFRRNFRHSLPNELEPIDWNIWEGLHDRLRRMDFRYIDDGD